MSAIVQLLDRGYTADLARGPTSRTRCAALEDDFEWVVPGPSRGRGCVAAPRA